MEGHSEVQMMFYSHFTDCSAGLHSAEISGYTTLIEGDDDFSYGVVLSCGNTDGISRKRIDPRCSNFRFIILIFILLISGCQKVDVGNPSGNNGAPLILTQANHQTGWNRLDCFTSGCHNNGINNFDPFSTEHEGATEACSSNECHGNNGVMDATLLCGQVFDDGTPGSTAWAENVTVKAVRDGEEVPQGSAVTDNYGMFAFGIHGSSSGSFRFVLDQNGYQVDSASYGNMNLLEIDGTESTAVSCSSCHGAEESGVPVLNMNPS